MRFGILCLIIVLTLQCNRTTYTRSNWPAAHLSFGTGGGFTGQEKGYYLFPNGQLFQIRGLQQDTMELERLKRKTAVSLFEEADTVFATHKNIQHAGNRYYFLRLSKEDLQQQAIWGATDYSLPSDIQGLYDKLQAILPPEDTDEKARN